MLLSKPEDWEVSVAWLVRHTDLGRDSIYKRLGELGNHGYAKAERVRKTDGTLGHTDWIIFDTPHPDLPDTANQDVDELSINNPHPEFQDMVPHPDLPDTAQPDTVKTTLINNISNTNNGNNKYMSGQTSPDPDRINLKESKAKLAKRIIEFLNSKTGKQYQAVRPNGRPTANGESVLSLFRHGYTEEDLRVVIARKSTEWTRPENRAVMEQYLRPKTLFAPKNFETYIGECVSDG